MEKENDEYRGCIELQMPLVTIQTCHDLDTGQVIHINGIAHRKQAKGNTTAENIQVEVKRSKNKMISVALYADAMGIILQKKLSEHWLCILDRIGAIDSEPTNHHSALDTTPIPTKPLRSRHNAKKKHKSKAHSNRTQSKQLQKLPKLVENSDIDLTKDTACLVEVKQDLESTTTAQDVDDCAKLIGSNDNIDSDSAEDLLVAKTETNSVDLHEEMELVAKDDNNLLEDSYISDHKLKQESKKTKAKSPKQELNLACKFCLKPFNKGKNPLMNLQKHVMKRCSKLQQRDDTTTLGVKLENDGPFFKCYFCPKSLSTKYNRDRHVEACSRNPANKADLSNCSVDLFYCEDCNWPTRTELDLHKHRVQNHGAPKKPRKKPSSPKPVSCRYCGEMFKFTSSRCNHEHFKCPKNLDVTKSFFCRYCGTRCRSQTALDDHTAQKHSDKKCTCKLCGAEFNTRNSKWHHMITVHRENPRRFACTHCEHTYLNKRMLLQHMTKHFDERKVQCTICGKCFKNQAQEKSHRLHIHEGRYRYRCDKCGHGVAKLQYLKTHKCGRVRRVQDGEIPMEAEPPGDVDIAWQQQSKEESPHQQQQPKEESPHQPKEESRNQQQQSHDQPPQSQAPQEEPLQQQLEQQPGVNHGIILPPQYEIKPQNNSVLSTIDAETIFYATQQAQVLPSFPQTIGESPVLQQMHNVPVQSLQPTNYLPSYNFLHYQNPNC